MSLLPLVVLCAVGLGSGCGGGGDADLESTDVEPSESTLTVYSGRSESLIGPLLEDFSEQTGIEVEARYGGTAEMAATLLEEGARSPADVFIAQDAGALGAVAAASMFRPMDGEVLSRVSPVFRSSEGLWVGISGRARVVVYNTERVPSEADLPQSLEEVVDPRFRGKWGVAPANGSFQAHMALYRAVAGPEALDEWLAAAVASEPMKFPNNRSIVEAVLNGEIEWGLVNHYYLWRALSENPTAPGKNFLQPDGEVSSFINVAGVGLLGESKAADRLVEFLLSSSAQEYFARETFEYPLVPGVATSVELTPLDQLEIPKVRSEEISANLEPALMAIQKSGLLS